MGLRERNKKLTRDALLLAARTLFEKQGYHATQMEEIAASAGVSGATAYNYFDSKSNIMTAVALKHVRNALPARRALLNNLPPEPINGIISFERLLAEQTLTTLGKRGWRVIFQAAYDVPPTNLTRSGKLFSWSIMRQYRRMFKIYRDRGSLRSDIDIDLATELITMIGTEYFSRYIRSDAMTVDELISYIPGYAEVVLAPWMVTEASP